MPESIRKRPKAEYNVSRLFSQPPTPSQAVSRTTPGAYLYSPGRQTTRSGNPRHQPIHSVNLSNADFLGPNLRNKPAKVPEYVCLIRFMDLERGTFCSGPPSILPSAVRCSAEAVLRSWVLRARGFAHPYKRSINCINPSLDERGVRGTLSRRRGKCAACRLCTKTARPCVRVLPDVRRKAKVGDLVIVLLPLSEELRHKKGEKN